MNNDVETVMLELGELESVDVDLSDLLELTSTDVQEIHALIEEQWPGFWAAYAKSQELEVLPAEVLPNETDHDDG